MVAFKDWIKKKMLTPTPSAAEKARGLGRNDLCWCGSGKKYKRCHLPEDNREQIEVGEARMFSSPYRRIGRWIK